MGELTPRCNRPCSGCPFRDDASAEDRELLVGYDPGGEHAALTEWVCHATLASGVEDDERLCAGAQIVGGLMSPIGRPPCSIPDES